MTLRSQKVAINGITGTPFIPHGSPFEGASAVKSASRVLEVFDYFYRFRSPARAADIAQYLEIPKSSTNGLLKTMVEAGYLTFEENTKRYFLSYRLVHFAQWLSSFYFGPNRLIALMNELQGREPECVGLTTQNGMFMQFVALLPSPGLPEIFGEGRKTPIVGSATGGALMMTREDDEIAGIVMRLTRGKSSLERNSECQEVLAQVNRFRKQGYAVNYRDPPVPDTITYAVPLPQQAGSAPLILSLAGLKRSLVGHEDRIIKNMKECIRNSLSENSSCRDSQLVEKDCQLGGLFQLKEGDAVRGSTAGRNASAEVSSKTTGNSRIRNV